MLLLTEGATTTTTEGILSNEVVTFVTDAVGDFIGILTTPPLGIFLTIGLLGSVVALTAGIVRMVKKKG